MPEGDTIFQTAAALRPLLVGQPVIAARARVPGPQIQRVVGGNLAEILDSIAYTIRERVRIQGEIRTLTAQARASGLIITLLPFALAGALTLISPDYFTPMFSDPLGHILLGMAIFSIAIGAAIIQKIVKIEV